MKAREKKFLSRLHDLPKSLLQFAAYHVERQPAQMVLIMNILSLGVQWFPSASHSYLTLFFCLGISHNDLDMPMLYQHLKAITKIQLSLPITEEFLFSQ